MRVLSITQVHHLLEVHEDVGREIAFLAYFRQVLRDLAVVAGGAEKGFSRKIEQHVAVQHSISILERLGDRVIVVR